MSQRNLEKVFIVIPVYNEEKIILSVIEEIQKAGFPDLIFVDDGSSDNTYRKIKDLKGIVALRHQINRGKGAAIKTGIECAKILKADVVVTLDGDGQHNPQEIHKMLKLLQEDYDVVLGSRMMNCLGMPFHKIIANKIANIITWLIYGLHVTDSQSGFRAFSKKAIFSINTKGDGYEYDSEVIREIKKKGLKYKEIPIEVRYTAYSMGKVQKQGFINGVKTVLRMFWSLIS